MAKILGFKRFFQRTGEPRSSYKNRHFFNTLDPLRRQEILLYAEASHIHAQIPESRLRPTVVFNDSRRKHVLQRLQAAETPLLLNYCYRDAPQKQTGRHTTIVGEDANLAIRRNFYELVLCPFVEEDFDFVVRFIKNLSGYLRNGAKLVLSVTHPQAEHMFYNQNPAETRLATALTSRYFRLLKECHFYTEEIFEGVVDSVLRPFFQDAEHSYFEEYRNTPVTLVFRAVKYEKTQRK